MGAGQSKHPSTEPPSASASASGSASVPSTDHSSVVIPESSSATKTGGGGGEGGGDGGGGGGGCPMKNPDGSYRTMPGFASMFGGGGGGIGRRHPPIAVDDGADPPSSSSSSSSSSSPRQRQQQQQQQQQRLYDVYSRPLPVDPTNGMPMSNPDVIARNSLPAPNQSSLLPTERVSSTIPRGGEGDGTWTYPSPQMFYNALVRKGKVDDETREEDMTSVVAIHNCMNEGTWRRILQWESVLAGSRTTTTTTTDGVPSSSSSSPRLTKFLGRPTDLSPKAYVKHHLFGHPLPFDRHDWTVSRTQSSSSSSSDDVGSTMSRDVRYVIDYYHDDVVANAEIGSGTPALDADVGPNGGLRSLLVDVRPAADGFEEIWGRAVLMPLARRGCTSTFECLLKGGHGDGPRSDFEPLPLVPSESLRAGLKESVEVWENIQRDAATGRGVGAMDGGSGPSSSAAAADGYEGSTSRDDVVDGRENGRTMTGIDATRLAGVYSSIVSQCEKSREAMRTCASESECHKARAGMTACAGKFACPLQHSSFMASLDAYATGSTSEDVAEARIDAAMEILGECVSGYERDATSARRRFPDLFDGAVSRGGKK